jgi:hypothetical protein
MFLTTVLPLGQSGQLVLYESHEKKWEKFWLTTFLHLFYDTIACPGPGVLMVLRQSHRGEWGVGLMRLMVRQGDATMSSKTCNTVVKNMQQCHIAQTSHRKSH